MHRLWTNVWTTGHRSPGHGRVQDARPGTSSSRSVRIEPGRGRVQTDMTQGQVDQVAETGVDYAQIWQQTLGTLDSVGLSNQERAFVRLCRLVGVLDQTALVRAPNTFTKDFLEQRVREQIHEALASQLGHPVQLAVSVDESLETDLGMISDEPSGQAAVHGGSMHGAPAHGGAGHNAQHNGQHNGSTGYGAGAHNPLRDLAESAPALNGADLDEPRQPAYPGGQTRMELGPDPLS